MNTFYEAVEIVGFVGFDVLGQGQGSEDGKGEEWAHGVPGGRWANDPKVAGNLNDTVSLFTLSFGA